MKQVIGGVTGTNLTPCIIADQEPKLIQDSGAKIKLITVSCQWVWTSSCQTKAAIASISTHFLPQRTYYLRILKTLLRRIDRRILRFMQHSAILSMLLYANLVSRLMDKLFKKICTDLRNESVPKISANMFNVFRITMYFLLNHLSWFNVIFKHFLLILFSVSRII